ncbi:MAG: elongation factor P [Anaerolineae bacterium]|nr:elongation factor P [Anaerolineae bacterium]MDH7473881.1 elongation factor P [Anaerolineae bacterium]
MATVSAGDLRKGLAIEMEGAPHLIVALEFVKPGKGQALYRCKLKNLITGQLSDRTYRSGDTFQTAEVRDTEMQYLYHHADSYYFMHPETYDQIEMSAEDVGEASNFLKEGMLVTLLLYEGRAIGFNLPNFVELEITETDKWVKGDTASSDTKTAVVETGYALQVPPFVEVGDIIKIDTRTGKYVERVKR